MNNIYKHNNYNFTPLDDLHIGKNTMFLLLRTKLKKLLCFLFGHKMIDTKEYFIKDKSIKNNFIEAMFVYCTAKKICLRCGRKLM